MNDFENKDPDKLAQKAFEQGDLELFTQALASGANPNAIPKGQSEPYVVILTARPMIDWVQAILSVPAFDATQRASDGKLPSAVALEGIEAWLAVDDEDTPAQEKMAISKMLRIAEMKASMAGNPDIEFVNEP